MCSAAMVSGVTVDDTGAPGDQAEGYKVEVSMDGTTWTTVASAATVPTDQPVLTVTFAPVMARYVKFDQTGMVGTTTDAGFQKTNWWSIYEFNVQCGGEGGAPEAGTPDASTEASAPEAGAPDTSTDSPMDSPGDAPGQ
jgi:hypothetical protein